jgi:hypothetical protein
MPKRTVTVKQDDEKPVEVEVLAQAIVDIGNAAKRLASSRLNRRAVVVLLNDMTGIAKGTIEVVLNSLEQLEMRYLKPGNRR